MHYLAGIKKTAEHRAKISSAKKGKPGIPGSGRPANTPDVLWSKVAKGHIEECWPWLGFKNKQGYGRTWINGKGYYAHRVIFNLAKPGIIELSAPKDPNSFGYLMHSCDNPCCCNPNHLIACTHQENMADKASKGRVPDFKSGKGPRCLLTMDQAREIRRLRKEENIPARELAKRYEISLPSIKTLLRGDSYKE